MGDWDFEFRHSTQFQYFYSASAEYETGGAELDEDLWFAVSRGLSEKAVLFRAFAR